MKLLKLMTCAVVMVAMIAANASAQNVLVNPGFELDPFVGAEQPGAGTGWNAFGANFRIQGQPPIGPAGAHGGTVVLKTFGNDQGAFQDFGAVEGDAWDASIWALNDSADQMSGNQSANLQIVWLDGGGGVVGDATNATFTAASSTVNEWEELLVSGVAPAGTATARFQYITKDNGGGGGAPRFDDAYFARGTAVPEPASVALLGLGALGLISRRRRS